MRASFGKESLCGERNWLLNEPTSRIDNLVFTMNNNLPNFRINTEASGEFSSTFSVLRDDLLHPIIGGNKFRKLDALIPFLKEHAVTDVVTCGGCQSAHAAALAVACAEHGMSAHLLLRGERLKVPTGYNLISGIYGNVVYIPRCEYANREEMFKKHARRIAGSDGCVLWLRGEKSMEDFSVDGRKVAVVEEGGSSPLALLGFIRLVRWLSRKVYIHRHDRIEIVIDSGTGTSAIGLAVGVALLKLNWEIVAIMLADTEEGYEMHKTMLLTEFAQQFPVDNTALDNLPLVWKERKRTRRFGGIVSGEMNTCRQIARQTGILLDPVYTLAAWEYAMESCLEYNREVVLLHTGGTLGLFGLAQRYPQEFST